MRFLILCLLPAILTLPAHAGGVGGAMHQSSAGMRVQSKRINIIAQNIANADSAGATQSAEPYRRKIIFFEDTYNPEAKTDTVTVKAIRRDYKSSFKPRFDPAHPAADNKGFVLFPNINGAVENADMREAQRSYEANLNAMTTSRGIYTATIDMLR